MVAGFLSLAYEINISLAIAGEVLLKSIFPRRFQNALAGLRH
jgi:hypothetical protein